MPIKHADNYNVRVFLNNGDEHLMHGNQIFEQGLAQFEGWYCNAGYDYIYVDYDDTVWAGQCQNEYLGNLVLDDIHLLQSPAACKRTTCTPCPTDLSAKKVRP